MKVFQFLIGSPFVIITIAVLLIIFAAVRVLYKKYVKGNTILIIGPVDAGKTALYYQMKQGVFRATQTSMQPNEDYFVPIGLNPKTAKLKFVDFPGHGTQRYRLSDYIGDTRAIIFVVDSVDINSIPLASTFLFEILIQLPAWVPLLIACNKTELQTAQSAGVIRDRMENYIEEYRKIYNQRGDLDMDGDDTNKHATIGSPDLPFNFHQLRNPVMFAHISAKKDNILPVLDFCRSQGC